MAEEVNKLIQENLNNFLQTEKLEILGNPIPKADGNFDWNADTLKFDFETPAVPAAFSAGIASSSA